MMQMCVGRQDFKRMIDEENSPYVDKSQLIEDVLKEDLLLYTRPRRFGKTLNMSMLYYFFSINEKENAYLFDGLKISKNKKAMSYLNQYPVINLSFGGVENSTLEEQIDGIGDVIASFLRKNHDLKNNKNLSQYQHDQLEKFERNIFERNELKNSLQFISECMYFIYNKKAIILIDEYDVPLNYSRNRYYQEFYDFYTTFLSKSLKYNSYIEKGVLTGCLTIAKNSSYTGLNNIITRTILEKRANDCFGFTQGELDELLEKCSLLEKRDTIKEWYNGYIFGGIEIYNPWSVCKYISVLQTDIDEEPGNYWLSTGSNIEIYDFISNGDEKLKKEMRQLIEGDSISKRIDPILTYRDLDHDYYSSSNIYSFLLYLGYLKVISPVFDSAGRKVRNTFNLLIPNNEVKEIYEDSFTSWFEEKYRNYKSKLIESLITKNTIQANEILNSLLFRSLSYNDYNEKYYHGFLSGLLETKGYTVISEGESGLGRYDLFIYESQSAPCILIECKVAKSEDDIYKAALRGINQIKDNKYIEGLKSRGFNNIIGYSISFYKKECYIIQL